MVKKIGKKAKNMLNRIYGTRQGKQGQAVYGGF